MILRKQNRKNTCGPTCFANLLNMLGYNVGIREADSACNLRKEGIDDDDLVNAFKKYGFNGKEIVCLNGRRAFKLLIQRLNNSPVILAVDADSHYILVLRADEKSVQIYDPLKKYPQTLTNKELLKRWASLYKEGTLYQGVYVIPHSAKSKKAISMYRHLVKTSKF
jgi:ABC-type bacteriocin/lantibiotic exporter with double-glycine peptidase domain